MSKKFIGSFIFLSILVIFGGVNYIHNVKAEKGQAIVVKNSKSIVYPHSLSVQEKNQVHNQNYLDLLKNQEEQEEKQRQEDEQRQATEEKQKQAEEQKTIEEQKKAIVASSSNTAVQKESASVNTATPSSNVQSASSAPVNTDHSSGFNFGNYHFPISVFSGNGRVPSTEYVYRWDLKANWYLLDAAGDAGKVVKSSVGMGTAITVDGKTYHVTDIQSGLDRNTKGAYYMWSHIDQHAIGFQTCDDATGIPVTLYFAD